MKKAYLPHDAECDHCECLIYQQTLCYIHGRNIFCTIGCGLDWLETHRQRTRTLRILDLCAHGYGLKEAVTKTTH